MGKSKKRSEAPYAVIKLRPAGYAELGDTEEWLELMAQDGWYPQKLTLGCLWRFEHTDEPLADRRWYIDVKASSQGLFGQEMLTPLLPKLKTVFNAEEIPHALTRKRVNALTVKPNPNYRLEQFAMEEGRFYYRGSRVVQHMTPDGMLRLVKLKRSEALLRRCRTAFTVWLLLFVIFCALLVWRAGMGFHLLLAVPLWFLMLHFAVSYRKLSVELGQNGGRSRKDKTGGKQ